MPFWPRDDEKRKENEKGKSEKEVEAIDEDILFLRSMKTNRTAHYATKDKAIKRRLYIKKLSETLI